MKGTVTLHGMNIDHNFHFGHGGGISINQWLYLLKTCPYKIVFNIRFKTGL